ncbi:DnaJ domain-containing protein [Terasakiella sp. SH-1]|uniref:J domain-containing protein n=1 Tax=Terasakiella sp. SH-1 TaxID=2560057 RepID=UPI001073ABF6|nr:DnaJ domain-containing protein [Terasakiella sp. SH-1]
MFHLILLFFALGVLYFLARWYVRAHPRDVIRVFKWIAIAFVAFLIIRLLFSGKFWLAVAALPALFVWFERFRTVFHVGRTLRNWFYGTPDPRQQQSQQQQSYQEPPQADPSVMSREEALDLFGLAEGAGEAEIKAAYHRLISQVHPDRGGSDYLAAKINQARDVLLND